MDNIAQYHQKRIATQDAQMPAELQAVLSGFCAKAKTAQKTAKQQRIDKLTEIGNGINDAEGAIREALEKRTNPQNAWEILRLVQWQLQQTHKTVSAWVDEELA